MVCFPVRPSLTVRRNNETSQRSATSASSTIPFPSGPPRQQLLRYVLQEVGFVANRLRLTNFSPQNFATGKSSVWQFFHWQLVQLAICRNGSSSNGNLTVWHFIHWHFIRLTLCLPGKLSASNLFSMSCSPLTIGPYTTH